MSASAGPGTTSPGEDGISDVVRPSVLRLLDRMRDLPAMVVNARGDILVGNDLAAVVLGELSAVPAVRRTHLWLHLVANETSTSPAGDRGAGMVTRLGCSTLKHVLDGSEGGVETPSS